MLDIKVTLSQNLKQKPADESALGKEQSATAVRTAASSFSVPRPILPG